MNTEYRRRNDRVAFVLTEVEPEYEPAVRDLYYQPVEGGFAKFFPANTPHLERIYAHFAQRAAEMVAQTAGRQPAPWEQALTAFLQRAEGHDIAWWLGGSAALAVRGLEVKPRDLDIITSEKDAYRLGELLLDTTIEPTAPSEGWIARAFGRAFWFARLEWVGGVFDFVDEPEPVDFGPAAARGLETVSWQNFAISVPPLALQLRTSERRGLQDRAETIRRFLRAENEASSGHDGAACGRDGTAGRNG